ncbi:Putative thioredoxin, Galactose-binding-like domain superfamily, PITH domain-containing protein [Septoria linicola]|uniref:Thioredoxin, Galactose-binding-like domain superfamily, PITH domain-containing protein n=1 Tax=Septoria linicola TaxID=215465 RepID=A0A9Q9ENV9_9PEZI|nr:Putative thioredoxin, Galactose-binding-like domain superfamily, PITH domain-containing protein [Septoria linicola]
MSSPIVGINSPSQFSQILSSSRIVVTDFWATWCGPCKAIAPAFEALAGQLSRPGTITFTKVDTDAQKDIARTYNISAMPTFLIFKAGREVKRIKGADPKGLNEAIKQIAIEAQQSDAGGGSSDAGPSGTSGGVWFGRSGPKGYSEVSEAVEIKGLDFLNVDGESGDRRSIFDPSEPSSLGKGKAAAGGKKDWIESDTDEQLMLYIPFQSTLKLHSLQITALPGDETTRPRTLHLYSNRSHVLGFDEAEDTPATQTVEIKESEWDEKTHTAKVDLRFVKFQNISSITIFVADGQGDDEKTRIDRVRLFGESGEKRAMGKLEKIGDEQGE